MRYQNSRDTKGYGDRIKYVSTPDDFFPCYEGDKVKVHFKNKKLYEKKFRVCVSGADDYIMVYDHWSRVYCKKVYKIIKDGITKKMLEDLGFVVL